MSILQKIKKILPFFKLIFFQYEILMIIGSMSVFGAWVIQNFQENDYKSQKEELIQKEENINRMFDARRIWLESLFTERAIKNDDLENDEVYFIKSYNYIETSLTTLSLINEITIADSVKRNQLKDHYNSIISRNNEYFKNKEYLKIAQTVYKLNSEEQFNLNKKFFESGLLKTKILNDIKNNEKKANDKFLLFYIFGSILIAINFLISKNKKDKK